MTTRQLLLRLAALSRRRGVRQLAALLAAILVLVAMRVTGTAASTRDTLIFMGFDTERAVLITALLGGALAAAVAGLLGGGRLMAALSGLAGVVVLFGDTFVAETQRALTATNQLGSFEPLGWIETAVALVMGGALVGLALGILAGELRGSVLALAGSVHAAWQTRRWTVRPAALARVIAAVMVVMLVAPSLDQMLSYSPDSLMLQGAADSTLQASIPVVGSLPSGSRAPVRAGSPEPATQTLAPGTGQVTLVTLPAPWTNGKWTFNQAWVYLPAGYRSGVARYPVIYEIPWPIMLYDQGVAVRQVLDQLIASGAMRPSIMVFDSSGGGPYVDSECINSADGHEWYDTFVATTLVHYVDSHYRTIASPTARTLLGDSQGGFCAANLLLRHPDVFRQEVSFSGYYMADPISRADASGMAVFANNSALALANSPMITAQHLPQAIHGLLEFVLVGNPAQPFYGPQLNAFSALLRTEGYRVVVIGTPYGHSWNGVRATLGAALVEISRRVAATSGVVAG